MEICFPQKSPWEQDDKQKAPDCEIGPTFVSTRLWELAEGLSSRRISHLVPQQPVLKGFNILSGEKKVAEGPIYNFANSAEKSKKTQNKPSLLRTMREASGTQPHVLGGRSKTNKREHVLAHSVITLWIIQRSKVSTALRYDWLD